MEGLGGPVNALVVEDESRVAKYLEETLRGQGYAVLRCATLEELRTATEAGTFVPDTVVLDRLLEGDDALGFLPELRRKLPESRILVLSALNTPAEKAAALDAGADDYLAKPFSSIELLARLRAIARRTERGARSEKLQLGDLVICGETRSAFFRGERLAFSNKEFLLLRTLGREPGRIYSRDELLERVWESVATVESNVVEVTVNNVRRKLERSAVPIRIRNMRHMGYWLEA
jgi:two-component system OmpR family response regulator